VDPWKLIVTGIPSVYMGWTIGADDAGAAMGTAVGAGAITVRRAVLMMAVMATLGAALEGGAVVKTLGHGIVKTHMDAVVAAIVVAVAAVWCHAAVAAGIPLSTTQATVGSIIGAGLALNAPVDWGKTVEIISAWILAPTAAGIVAFLVSRAFTAWIRRGKRSLPELEKIFRIALTFSGCYVAYSIGANNAANAVVPLVLSGVLDVRTASILGGITIALGALTAGNKVIETVGHRITQLDPPTAFSAQVAAAVTTHLGSVLGLPLSINETTSGAVIGVGLSRGSLNTHVIKRMALTWAISPASAALISYLAVHAYLHLT